MEDEFVITPEWRLYNYIASLAICGIAVLLLTMVASKGPIMIVLSILLVGYALYIIVNQEKSRVSISDKSIVRTTIFKSTELALENIKGVRIDGSLISVEADSAVNSKITIENYKHLGNYEELLKWLKVHFTDLDATDYDMKMSGILNDKNLGFTAQDRKETLSKSKLISIFYNILGSALIILSIFSSNKIVVNALLIYPLLSIPIVITSKGLIKVLPSKSSPHSYIIFGILMASIMLLAKGNSDSSLISYNKFWFPFILVTLNFSLILALINCTKILTLVRRDLVFIVAVAALYGFGCVLEVNSVYDFAAEKIFYATVLNKNTTTSFRGGSSYNLTISPWGPQNNTNQISVNRYLYENAPLGSNVTLHLRKGLFHIPWFIVSTPAR